MSKTMSKNCNNSNGVIEVQATEHSVNDQTYSDYCPFKSTRNKINYIGIEEVIKTILYCTDCPDKIKILRNFSKFKLINT